MKCTKIKISWSSFNALQYSQKWLSASIKSVLTNKQIGQLINISPNSLIILETIHTEFTFIDIWFTDENSKPSEI